MKLQAMDYLVDPYTEEPLKLYQFEFDQQLDEVKAGILFNEASGKWYPIHNYVPRICENGLFDNTSFRQRWEKQLSRYENGYSQFNADDQTEMGVLYDAEYKIYPNNGFGKLFNKEKDVFHTKSLYNEVDFLGSVCLDAGCGNGRYAYWAALSGAKIVFALDISANGIEACHQNTAGMMVVPIQASINNLPFRKNIFDLIYSIGVLQYVQKYKDALTSIFRVTKLQGQFSLHVFQQQNSIYEKIDMIIKNRVSAYDHRSKENFVKKIQNISSILGSVGLLKLGNAFVHLETHEQSVFNWYFVPSLRRYEFDELEQFCSTNGFKMIKSSNEKDKSNLMKFLVTLSPRSSFTQKYQKC